MQEKTGAIMKLPSVLAEVQLSRSTVYAMVKNGDFPKPSKLSTRVNAWNSRDITAWIESRLNQSPSQSA